MYQPQLMLMRSKSSNPSSSQSSSLHLKLGRSATKLRKKKRGSDNCLVALQSDIVAIRAQTHCKTSPADSMIQKLTADYTATGDSLVALGMSTDLRSSEAPSLIHMPYKSQKKSFQSFVSLSDQIVENYTDTKGLPGEARRHMPASSGQPLMSESKLKKVAQQMKLPALSTGSDYKPMALQKDNSQVSGISSHQSPSAIGSKVSISPDSKDYGSNLREEESLGPLRQKFQSPPRLASLPEHEGPSPMNLLLELNLNSIISLICAKYNAFKVKPMASRSDRAAFRTSRVSSRSSMIDVLFIAFVYLALSTYLKYGERSLIQTPSPDARIRSLHPTLSSTNEQSDELDPGSEPSKKPIWVIAIITGCIISLLAQLFLVTDQILILAKYVYKGRFSKQLDKAKIIIQSHHNRILAALSFCLLICAEESSTIILALMIQGYGLLEVFDCEFASTALLVADIYYFSPLGQGVFCALKMVQAILTTAVGFLLAQASKQVIVNRKKAFELERKLVRVKADYERAFEIIPQGVMIYQTTTGGSSASSSSSREQQNQNFSTKESQQGTTKSESSQRTASGKAINIEFVNQELVKALSKGNVEEGEGMETLIERQNFRVLQAHKKKWRSEDLISLKTILEELSDVRETMFFKFETYVELQDKKKIAKQVIHMEVLVRELMFNSRKSFIVTIQNINNVIQNQNSIMQSYYQEALTATISHEQMTPLNSIINFSKILYDNTKDYLASEPQNDMESSSSDYFSEDESQHGAKIEVCRSDLKQQLAVVQIVHRSSMMMKLLNEAMINSTMIKQGKYKSKCDCVRSPFPIISNLAGLFDSHLKQLNIQLEIDDNIYGNIEGVEAMKRIGIMLDIKLYEQIMYNIFLNACKFNKNDGTIKITFQVLKEKQYYLTGDVRQLKVITIIEDTGIGMDPRKQASLFKVFDKIKQRANPMGDESDSEAEAQTTSGFGLGLYLSLQLAQFLHGNISIESKVGVGTTAKISFFANVAKENAETGEESDDAKKTSSMVVLNPEKASPFDDLGSLNRQNSSKPRRGSHHYQSKQKKTEKKRDLEMPEDLFKAVLQKKLMRRRSSSLQRQKEKTLAVKDETEGRSQRYHKKSQFFTPSDEKEKTPVSLKMLFFDKIDEDKISFNNTAGLNTPTNGQTSKVGSPMKGNTLTVYPNGPKPVGLPDSLQDAESFSSISDPSGIGPKLDQKIRETLERPGPKHVDLENIDQGSDISISLQQYFEKYDVTMDINMPVPTRKPTSNLADAEIEIVNSLPPQPIRESQDTSVNGEDESKPSSIIEEDARLMTRRESKEEEEDLDPFITKWGLKGSEATKDDTLNQLDFRNGLARIEEVDECLECVSIKSKDLRYKKFSQSTDKKIVKNMSLISSKGFEFSGSKSSSIIKNESIIVIPGRAPTDFSSSIINLHSEEHVARSEGRSSFNKKRSLKVENKALPLVGIQDKRKNSMSDPTLSLRISKESSSGTRTKPKKLCCCNKSPILIVDDNIFNLETLKLILKTKFSIEPSCANNGKEAFEIFKARNKVPDLDLSIDSELTKKESSSSASKSSPLKVTSPLKKRSSSKQKSDCTEGCQNRHFKLILMDLNMPVMDGFEATQKILEYQEKTLQTTSELPTCKIIALTAFVNKENIARCTEVGMGQVLNKPIDHLDLKEIMSSVCPHLVT